MSVSRQRSLDKRKADLASATGFAEQQAVFRESGTEFFASAPSELAALFGSDGVLSLDGLQAHLGLSKTQLAETIGVHRDTIYRSERFAAPKTQARTTEMVEIVHRITSWAGGARQALAWYRAEPLPAFGDRTAESLVKDGKAGAVRDYLDHIATGGFA